MDVQTFIYGTTLQDFIDILYRMSDEGNRDSELLFSTDMIDQFCEEGKFLRYEFGCNLQRHIYWRMVINNISVEYVIIPEIRKQDYNAHVHRICHNGQAFYTRPYRPKGTIHLVWPPDAKE